MSRTLHLVGVHTWVAFRVAMSGRLWWQTLLVTAWVVGFWFLALMFRDVVFLLAVSPWITLLVLQVAGPSGRALVQDVAPIPIRARWMSVVPFMAHVILCALCVLLLCGGMFHGLGRIPPGHGWFETLYNEGIVHRVGWFVLGSLPLGLWWATWLGTTSDPSRKLRQYGESIGGATLAALTGGPVIVILTVICLALRIPEPIVIYLALAAAQGLIISAITGFAIFVKFLRRWGLGRNLEHVGVRTGLRASERLRADFWRSQRRKWALMCTAPIGIWLVFWVAPGLREDLNAIHPWLSSIFFGLCGGVLGVSFLLPLVIQMGGWISKTHHWKDSPWSLLPLPRERVQAVLLADLIMLPMMLVVITMIGIPLLVWLDVLSYRSYGHVFVVGLPIWFSYLILMTVLLIPFRRRGWVLLSTALFIGVGILYLCIKDPFLVSSATTVTPMVVTMLMITAMWGVWMGVVWHQIHSPTVYLTEADHRRQKRVRWFQVVFVVIAALGAHRFVVHQGEADRLSQRITVAQTDRLIADLEAIHDLGVFEDIGQERDAGEILNPLLALDNNVVVDDPPWWADKGHRALLTRKGAHWTQGPDDLPMGDLSIMTALLEYDHWEPSSSGTYREYLETEDHPFAWDTGITNMVPLQYLAKFRLVQGMRSGDMLAALREVRHLTRLVYSSETLIGAMVANGLISTERKAYESALEMGLLESGDWTPVAEEDAYAFRRAGMSMSVVLSGWASRETWKRIEALPFTPFGLCAGIGEAVHQLHIAPPVWPVPLERFPRQDTEFLQLALWAKQCRVPLAREAFPMVRSWDWWEWRDSMQDELSPATMLILTVPFVRGPLWLTLPFGERPPFLMYGDTPEQDWSGMKRR